MATVGPNDPLLVEDVELEPFTGAWADTVKARVADDDPSTNDVLAFGTFGDSNVRLYVDGAFAGNNKATLTNLTGSFAYQSWGGEGDLWGLPSLTGAQVKSLNFGFAAAYGEGGGVQTHYIRATRCFLEGAGGDDIPDDAVITGVKAEVRAKWAIFTPQVDHMRMTVWFTEAAGGDHKSLSLTGVG